MPTASILILFAEDELPIQLATTEALEASGFAVQPVRSGDEAIFVLDGGIERIKALVTDIRLGAGPNGWEVARHARQLSPDIPVIYTTGDSRTDWPAEGVPKSVLIQKLYAKAQVATALADLLNANG